MPIFKSRNTFDIGRKARLFFGVEIELTGLGRIRNALASRLGAKAVKSAAPPRAEGQVTAAPARRRVEPADEEDSGKTRLCKVCDLPDWEDEEFRAILDELDLSWAKERKHRKAWEFAQGIRGLKHLGALRPEATALGVGAGHEAPLYYLTNHIKEVHATDIYGSGDFAGGEGSAEMLTDPKKFAPFPYREDRLVVKHMDGRKLQYPDETFDIAFSFSSIEHFGGKDDASRAMREMARVLRPGGIAAITTELILNDVSHREFFRPRQLNRYLIRSSELELVEEIDFTISPSLLEKPIDLGAFVPDKFDELWAFGRCEHSSEHLYNLDWSTDYGDILPYIVLKTGPVVFTSLIMFLRKPA